VKEVCIVKLLKKLEKLFIGSNKPEFENLKLDYK